MSFELPDSRVENPGDYHSHHVAVPDRFREQATNLLNEEYERQSNVDNQTLAESILRDRILPYCNGRDAVPNEFEPSRRPGGRYDPLKIDINVPREMGYYLEEKAKEAEAIPHAYNFRVRYNTPVEEFICRYLILGSFVGESESIEGGDE